MTIYQGELVSILVTRVRDGLGNDLSDVEVDSVTVVIYDSTGTEVLAEAAATWDGTLAGWVYDWDTSAEDPGQFVAEVNVNSIAPGPPGIEFIQFRLARSPVPVP